MYITSFFKKAILQFFFTKLIKERTFNSLNKTNFNNKVNDHLGLQMLLIFGKNDDKLYFSLL